MAIKPIEGFYVHDEETNTDGVAKVSIDAVHEFVEDVSGTVVNWLDEHPEATTTVQDDSLTTAKYKDGSVTYDKIADTLKMFVTPEMFGAKGDGETDDTEALQQAFTNEVVYLKGKYLVSEPLDASAVNVIISDNAEIFGSVDAPILSVDKFSYTELGNLNTAAVEGETSVLFDGGSVGDYIAIMSNTSWNPARAYYMGGEFNKIVAPGLLEHGMYESYTTDATAYKLGFGKLSIDGGLTIKNETGTVNAEVLSVRGLANSSISGVSLYGKGTNTFRLRNCKNVNVTAYCECTANTYGTDYGLIIENSQDIIVNGEYYGNRHAVTTGGGSSSFNIVNRNIVIDGVFKNNPNMRVASVDTHGNCENVTISGQIETGVSFGGRNITISDVSIVPAYNETYGKIATGIYGSELMPGDFNITNFSTYGYSGSTSGIQFDFSGGGAPSNINISNGTIKTNKDFAVRTLNTGTVQCNVTMSNVQIFEETSGDIVRWFDNDTATLYTNLYLKNVNTPNNVVRNANIKSPDNTISHKFVASDFSKNSEVTTAHQLTGTVYGVMKRLRVDLTVTPSATGYRTLLTLPQALRPVEAITFLANIARGEGGEYVILFVDGKLQVNFASTSQKRIYFELFYF